MITLLSPAKSLDYKSEIPLSFQSTSIPFPEQSADLIAHLKQLSATDIAALMKVNMDLATLNYERFQNWEQPLANPKAKAAVYAFNGDVYRGLDAYTMKNNDLAFAQSHLLILSGLYGALRPMDAIMPYRLEMGTKLQTAEAKTLYAFWGDKIAKYVLKCLQHTASHCIVNLASAEYFKSVEKYLNPAQIITPVFMQLKGNNYKQIAVYAKKARGLMSRFIIDNQIEQVEDLKAFDRANYVFHQQLSTDTKWVFTR